MDDRGSMGKSTIRDDSGAISKRAISNRAVIVVRIGVGRAIKGANNAANDTRVTRGASNITSGNRVSKGASNTVSSNRVTRGDSKANGNRVTRGIK